jgi:hypothetical protein
LTLGVGFNFKGEVWSSPRTLSFINKAKFLIFFSLMLPFMIIGLDILSKQDLSHSENGKFAGGMAQVVGVPA